MFDYKRGVFGCIDINGNRYSKIRRLQVHQSDKEYTASVNIIGYSDITDRRKKERSFIIFEFYISECADGNYIFGFCQ